VSTRDTGAGQFARVPGFEDLSFQIEGVKQQNG
jgi:hypothetical protein